MRVKLLCLALLLSVAASRYSWSQDIITRPAPSSIPPGAAGRPTPPGATPGAPPKRPPRPSTAKKKQADTSAKPGGAKGKVDEKPKVIKRPDKPATPADPEELKVQPDAAGLIQFSFRGQPWPDVLAWLSGVSNMSLDWQELPSDYLNLTTQRRYTIEESRDLINRHLLARGFTLLSDGELLSVAKIAEISRGRSRARAR